MKKLLALFALVCVMGTAAVAMNSCNNNEKPGEQGGEVNPTEHKHSLTKVDEVPATCEEAGTESYYKCSGCTKLFADKEGKTEIKAPAISGKLGHSFTSYESDDNATCTADGTKTADCDRCDETDTVADVDSKLGHDYTEKIEDDSHLKASAENCQSVNTYWYDCSRCDSVSDKLYFDSEAVGEHSVSLDWTAEDGKHFHKCTVDGCSYKVDEAACSDADNDNDHLCDVCEAEVGTHSFGTEWKNDEANHWHVCNCGEKSDVASHVDGDPLNHKCDVCEKVVSEHSYTVEVVNELTLKTAANCTDAAVYYKSCACGEISETETFTYGIAKDHTPAEAVKENENPASCNTDGSYDSVVYCSVEGCGAEISREKVTVSATGDHNYATEQERKAETCEDDGYVIWACGCGETYTEILTKLDHNVSIEWTTENGKHFHKCTVDGCIYVQDEAACSDADNDNDHLCDTCNATVGEHSYVLETVDESTLKTAANCTDAAVYYKTCDCGAISTTETFISGSAKGHSYEPAVTAPTCTEAGYTTYTCACGDSYIADETTATGHSWISYELTTAPTYEAAGVIGGTCANCDDPTAEIPAVSEENGYTALITGVVTRWQYTYDGYTFTVDVANDVETTTYSYGTEAWYIDRNGDGTPIMLEGYKHTTGTWSSENGYEFYASKERNYVTTISVDKPTTVTLVLTCARNKTKPFFNIDGTEHVLEYLYLNGSSDGVICDMDAYIADTTNDTWQDWKDYSVATLFLEEGDNTVSFRTYNSTNFYGIGFISTEEIHMHTYVIDAAVDAICTAEGKTMGIHCSECNEVIVAQETIPVSGEHTWSDSYSVTTSPNYVAEGSLALTCTVCGTVNEDSIVTLPKVSEENGYTKVDSTDTADNWQYTYNEVTYDIAVATYFEFTVADNNPFLEEVGGSFGNSKYVNDSTKGKYYEETPGQTFTLTVNVEEATNVVFIIKLARNGKSNTINNLITSLKVNDTDMTSSISAETIYGVSGTEGWYDINAVDAEIAVITLQKGTNTIEFTRGSTGYNFNVCGVAFESTVPVALGAATTATEE